MQTSKKTLSRHQKSEVDCAMQIKTLKLWVNSNHTQKPFLWFDWHPSAGISQFIYRLHLHCMHPHQHHESMHNCIRNQSLCISLKERESHGILWLCCVWVMRNFTAFFFHWEETVQRASKSLIQPTSEHFFVFFFLLLLVVD